MVDRCGVLTAGMVNWAVHVWYSDCRCGGIGLHKCGDLNRLGVVVCTGVMG